MHRTLPRASDADPFGDRARSMRLHNWPTISSAVGDCVAGHRSSDAKRETSGKRTMTLNLDARKYALGTG